MLPWPGQDDDDSNVVVQGQGEELTEHAAVLPAARQRGPKANRHKPAAAASVLLTACASAAQDSDARGSHTGMSGAQNLGDHHSAAQLTQPMHGDPETQQQADTGVTHQAEPHLADTEADLHQHSSRGTESHEPQHQQLDAVGQAGTTQPHASVASQRAESQPADSATLSEAQEDQQQLQLGQALLPGLLGVLRKEALCLRVRPLDALTKRLMQALGCTALLELPNNK